MNDTTKKTVGVLISQSPATGIRVSETLRMAVGLTLGKSSVRIFFSGDGVMALLKGVPEETQAMPIAKHIETLTMLKCKIAADEQALSENGIDADALVVKAETLPREIFLHELSRCEVLFNV